MRQSYYSSGKLLITGEYLVLHGASALAVPLRVGQSLTVNAVAGKKLTWSAREYGREWFAAEYLLPEMEIIRGSTNEQASKLRELLLEAARLNPSVLAADHGFEVITDLYFNLNWGLGSSSTLVSNVASWFGIDPYELFFRLYKGSGYDIACARTDRPLLYRLHNNIPEIIKVDFYPSFHQNIFFVYTGKKQDSNREVEKFRKTGRLNESMI
jgi:mevalonate kinase